jgi:hypothetical protein
MYACRSSDTRLACATQLALVKAEKAKGEQDAAVKTVPQKARVPAGPCAQRPVREHAGRAARCAGECGPKAGRHTSRWTSSGSSGRLCRMTRRTTCWCAPGWAGMHLALPGQAAAVECAFARGALLRGWCAIVQLPRCVDVAVAMAWSAKTVGRSDTAMYCRLCYLCTLVRLSGWRKRQ